MNNSVYLFGGGAVSDDTNERCLRLVEHLNDLGKVGETAGEPVDLVDNHNIDPASLPVIH